MVLRGKAACIRVLIAIGFLGVPGHARADEQTAKGLFEAGRSAVIAGNYQLACEKFAASFAMDPAIGTELNLANCREQLGDLVEAKRLFEDAAARATDGRRRFARERADALAARIDSLSASATPTSQRRSYVGEALLGPAIPIVDSAWRANARTSATLSLRGGIVLDRITGLIVINYSPIGLDAIGPYYPQSNQTIDSSRWTLLAALGIERVLSPRLVWTARGGVGIDYISATVKTGTQSFPIPSDTGFAFAVSSALWLQFGPVQLGAEVSLPFAHHHGAPGTVSTTPVFDYNGVDIDLLFGVRLTRP